MQPPFSDSRRTGSLHCKPASELPAGSCTASRARRTLTVSSLLHTNRRSCEVGGGRGGQDDGRQLGTLACPPVAPLPCPAPTRTAPAQCTAHSRLLPAQRQHRTQATSRSAHLLAGVTCDVQRVVDRPAAVPLVHNVCGGGGGQGHGGGEGGVSPNTRERSRFPGRPCWQAMLPDAGSLHAAEQHPAVWPGNTQHGPRMSHTAWPLPLTAARQPPHVQLAVLPARRDVAVADGHAGGLHW